jgi:hypothetical protein
MFFCLLLFIHVVGFEDETLLIVARQNMKNSIFISRRRLSLVNIFSLSKLTLESILFIYRSLSLIAW